MAIPSPQVISAVDTVSDQRLDIDGTVWQLSTNTNESVILYGITDNAGTNYEIGYLKERPAALNFYDSNAAPAVSGETEVTTLGAIASTKFYVDYDRAFILFPNGHSTPVNVTYRGMGSIQKAIDVNAALATGASAALSESWATKDDGAVSGGDFSSKANASVVGANAPAEGSAKEWAQTTGAVIADSEYSAKEYAIGTTVAAGSAKDWAVLPENSLVDGGSGYSALHWAAKAETTYDNFDDRYLGAKSSAPSVDNDNQTLIAGALYFNSSDSTMYVRSSGSAWVQATSVDPVSMTIYKYIATAAQTSFSGADANSATLAYTAANINVYLNGVRLDETDYTATNGTSVVLDDGALVDDELVVIAFRAFQSSRYVDATGGTFTGAVTCAAGLTANTADINAGTFDGIVGGTTPAVGTFTTLVATTINGTEINHNDTNNIGIGATALNSITSGDYNVALGAAALTAVTGTSESVAIGHQACEDNTAAESTAVGTKAMLQNVGGTGNTAVGHSASLTNVSGVSNTAVGYKTLYNNTANANTGMGWAALHHNTADANTAFGYSALYTHTTGSFCTAIGYEALSLSNTNTDNTAVGYQALKNCVVGASLQTGAKNVAVGAGALTGCTDGYQNTAMGYLAGYQMAGGRDNVAIGYGAMYAGTGNGNTCVGWQAGLNLATGGGSVLIGSYAGTSVSPVLVQTTSDIGCWGNDLTGPNYIDTDWTVTSDERDKADIVSMTHGLDVLENITPINYFWDKRTYYWDTSDMDNIIKHEGDGSKKRSDLRLGFSAQKVKAVLDAVGYTGHSVVDSRDEENLKITNSNMIPFLVNAVKELSTQVKTLTAKVTALESA